MKSNLRLIYFHAHKTFFLILAITSISIFNQVKPNRTNLKFIDNDTFLYAHLQNLYQFNLQNGEKKIIRKLEHGDLFTGIFTNPNNLTICAAVEGSFSSGFIQLNVINQIEFCALGYYQKKSNADTEEYADKLCISQNGKTLIHASKFENSVRSINTISREFFSTNLIDLGLDVNDLRAVNFTDDGKVIVLNFYKDGTICIWLTDKNKPSIIGSGMGNEYFFDFALSPNGEKVVSISSGAELFDTQKNTFETIFRWDPDTNDIKDFSWDQKIDLLQQLDYKKFSSLKKLYYRSNPTPDYLSSEVWGRVTKAIFSENSNYIFLLINLYAKRNTTLESHWRLKIFDIKNSCFIKTIDIEELHKDRFDPENIEDMSISPDGKNLILIDRYAKNLSTQYSSNLLIDDINVTLIPIETKP